MLVFCNGVFKINNELFAVTVDEDGFDSLSLHYMIWVGIFWEYYLYISLYYWCVFGTPPNLDYY